MSIRTYTAGAILFASGLYAGLMSAALPLIWWVT